MAYFFKDLHVAWKGGSTVLEFYHHPPLPHPPVPEPLHSTSTLSVHPPDLAALVSMWPQVNFNFVLVHPESDSLVTQVDIGGLGWGRVALGHSGAANQAAAGLAPSSPSVFPVVLPCLLGSPALPPWVCPGGASVSLVHCKNIRLHNSLLNETSPKLKALEL